MRPDHRYDGNASAYLSPLLPRPQPQDPRSQSPAVRRPSSGALLDHREGGRERIAQGKMGTNRRPARRRGSIAFWAPSRVKARVGIPSVHRNPRPEKTTPEFQSLMPTSHAVFLLKNKKT